MATPAVFVPRKPPTPRRNLLSTEVKDEMLAILIRNRQAFDVVSPMLTPEHLQSASDAHALIWLAAKKFHEGHMMLPPEELLSAAIHNELSENPDMVADEELANIDELLAYAFSPERGDIATSSLKADVAISNCQKLLQDIHADRYARALSDNGRVPEDLDQVYNEASADLAAIKALNTVDFEVPFPEGWDKRESVKLFSCGVSALDDFMGGGWRSKDVVLFLGPYGSCKTTVACQSVSNLATYCRTLLATKTAKRNAAGKLMRPVVVLVFSEGDKDEYRVRLQSHAARVPWQRLNTMQSLDELNTSTEAGVSDREFEDGVGNPVQYEELEFAADLGRQRGTGVAFRSEQDRVRLAAKLFNDHLVLIDATDTVSTQTRVGSGGMRAVASVIEAYFRRHTGRYPVAVWVDHLSALADREISAKGGNEAQYSSLLSAILKKMPLIAKESIGARWDCPVGLLHQLSGQANKKGAGASLHHSEGAGSAAVAEYAVFAVTTTSTDNAGFCRFQCSKHRRVAKPPIKVIEVVGQFNRVSDRSGEYVYDADRRKIHRIGDDRVNQTNSERARVTSPASLQITDV